MINAFCNCFQSVADAATPWLKCVAALCFLAWLAMLLWEYGAASEDVAKFKALSPFKKLSVVAVLCMFTLLGGTKEGGDRGGVSGGLRRSSSDSQQLRTSPPALEATSNLLAITAFEVSHSNCTVSFETSWATNLFDYTDSRNLYLFSSTNLQERQWMPLGQFLMPSGTNSYGFAVTSNNVDVAMCPWFLDTFIGVGFYQFGLDVDYDGDGLTDSYENLVILTNPFSTDTDADGLSDSQELAANIGTNPLLYDTDDDGVSDGDEVDIGTNPLSLDSDSDGLSDAQENGFIRKSEAFIWHDTEGLNANYNVGYWFNDTGLSDWWCTPVSYPIASYYELSGLVLTYFTALETGYISFSSVGDSQLWIFTFGPMPLNQNIFNSGSIFVAAYWNDSYLCNGDTNSYIKAGTVLDGSYVVEFHDVRRAPYATQGMTYQVCIPPGAGDVVQVSYHSSDYWLDGEGAVAGIQNKRIMTASGYYNLTWDFAKRGPILPGTTIEYHLGYGTDPLVSDSDDDGLIDGFEVATFGTSPLMFDTDRDTLSDGLEYVLGTNPLSSDTDGDGLFDDWEVANSLDPLIATGADGALGDNDNDGLTNAQEYQNGTDPWNDDCDGDGLLDGDEVSVYGTNPLSPNMEDPDLDGLSDAVELLIGTNPLEPDSDGDGMNDGWEWRYIGAGFDPRTNNASDSNPDNNLEADPDGDGLTNRQECEFGTNPSGFDDDGDGAPDGYDSDGDGVNDGAEILQHSDPTDLTDGGQPNRRTPVYFTFGDPSGSHSEKYRLFVEPVSAGDYAPMSFSWLNENYGQCEVKEALLSPGWTYMVRMCHAGTNGTGAGYPDYDYQLECNTNTLPRNVLIDDPCFLFGSDYSSTQFTAAGKTAYITVYSATVKTCDPGNPEWEEMEESRVLLDTEDLRLKVEISPAVSSLEDCMRLFGSNLVLRTSGTCTNGVNIAIIEQSFTNFATHSEIRISKTWTQLKLLGLVPLEDEDGIAEMSWLDMGNADPTQGSNLTDSEAFSSLGYAFRGKATADTTQTLDSIAPNSTPSPSFFMAAGSEILTAEYGGVTSARRQIMNQSDMFYYSGHGSHSTGSLSGGLFSPAMINNHWNKDLDCVIIAGCSVLNIGGYRANSFTDYSTRIKYWFRKKQSNCGESPGILWENVGPKYFLGYCWTAPLDGQGADLIAAAFVDNIQAGVLPIEAWREANNRSVSRNACALDVSSDIHKFWYWDETSGIPVWTNIVKGVTSW